MNPYGGTPTALRVSVNALILNDDGQVLLQHRADNGYWNLPGGGLELGESLETALHREVMEETGLTVRVVRLVGVYSDPAITTMAYPDGRVLQYVTALFKCRVLSGQPRADHESLALGWFSPSALPEPFSPNHRSRIQDALTGLEAAFFR